MPWTEDITAIEARRLRTPLCPTCGRRSRMRSQAFTAYLRRCAWGHEWTGYDLYRYGKAAR